ncbi:cytochrome c oxidase subunit 4 [Demequina iriomotensis]|uniref:cytochrome c oxidase subunit 4 n=1 Tax=Demequina iriomotensis TaxID=1536641 RepID=UPI0007865C1F|nr:cytochrome c oxidase subunit 4 [Demequina iriomotensis]
MRTEANIFIIPAAFFFLAGTAYGIFTHWAEWVGFLAIYLTGGMFAMVAVYFKMLEKRHGKRAEDREDAEISEDAGVQGTFAPWSWWPLVVGAGAALSFVALAVGWWIMAPAVVLGVIGLVGWVMEFSRGQHAH